MSLTNAPNFYSLFSGCGGLDCGFIDAGFQPKLSVDLDQNALNVHRNSFASPVQQLDLSASDPTISKRARMDVLLSGSPCQGFSTMGQRRLNDPRNSLLLVAARLAAKHRPKVVVAENVPGALSGEHRRYWEDLHIAMRTLGYKTCDYHVDSADYGVPQTRRRVVMIAWRTRAIAAPPLVALPKLTLGEALQNLEGLPNHSPMLLPVWTKHYQIACRIGPGQKLTNARAGQSSVHTWHVPEVFGFANSTEQIVLATVLRLRRQDRRRSYGDADPVPEAKLIKLFGADILDSLVQRNYLRRLDGYFDLTNTFNGKYRRPAWNGLSRTVDTRFGDFTSVLHPLENRSFTVREAARIQGFPDNVVFNGTIREQFRMIGNAVPPPMAFAIANSVRSLL